MSVRSVRVAVPMSSIRTALSYAVPASWPSRSLVGCRVHIPLNQRRMVGVVLEEEIDTPQFKLKTLLQLLDDEPVVTPEQIAMVQFVSSYYFAPIGVAARLILPPDTAKEVDRRYSLAEAGHRELLLGALHGRNSAEMRLLQLLADEAMHPRSEIKRHNIPPSAIESLLKDGCIEEHAVRGAGKVREIERLVAVNLQEEGVQPLPARSPALAAVDAWLRVQTEPVTYAELEVAFKSGRGKGKKLVELGRARIIATARAVEQAPMLAQRAANRALTDDQSKAVAAIRAYMPGPKAFLLEGVTGSGKTEVYLTILRDVLAKGRGALFIVPEISLTPQLLSRVRASVQEAVASSGLSSEAGEVVALHSGLSEADRRDALALLRSGRVRIALGARSALFAPMPDLGLIVVDEEHDGSLKQADAPRYHARDVALWRAHKEKAIVILGSATPSLESLHNAQQKKLHHLFLATRIGGGGVLPKVEVIDLRARKGFKASKLQDQSALGEPGVVLSKPMVDALTGVLERGEQALLFLNRRGYANVLLCQTCGTVRGCPSCSVSLTVHRGSNRLRCHQCDYEEMLPKVCLACASPDLVALGMGTERVEAEVKARFPTARVARLDRDVVRQHEKMVEILQAVDRREIDIVVGTQMIAKGHDFPWITLVGVILADIALAMPDFRSAERAFSLLTQVSGRAGRGTASGRVLVQTYMPEHPAVVFSQQHDAAGFMQAELALRQQLRYPPFWNAALIRIEGHDANVVAYYADAIAKVLREAAQGLENCDVMGPAPCALERIKDMTRHQVFVRTIQRSVRNQVLEYLLAASQIQREMYRSQCHMIIDVDPMHLM